MKKRRKKVTEAKKSATSLSSLHFLLPLPPMNDLPPGDDLLPGDDPEEKEKKRRIESQARNKKRKLERKSGQR